MYCIAPAEGGAWISRPSVKRVGTLQLGSGTTRNGQCVYNHTRPDGTEDRLLFAGGKMYRWNGFPTSGDATVATATDITPGAVTISTTARIYCVSFAGLLIVSDGVNKPWKYDPATATATYLPIDTAVSAWTAYGPPVVYGGKLVFILASKGGVTYQNTFVWSEEVDPSLGYYQNGYTNFWTLFQTSADRLTCLVATNAGLYYFRPDSIGFITGTVNAAFQTTAQHDAISTTVGTLSPAAVVLVDEGVYFIDRRLRPHRLARGRLEELWRAAPDVGGTSDVGTSGSPLIETAPGACYVPEVRAVLFECSAQGGPGHSPFVYDVATGAYFGSWTFPLSSMRAMGTLRNGEGVPVTVVIGTSDAAGALGVEGYVYRFMARGEATTWDSSLWGASVGKREIQVILGSDVEADQLFHQVVAEVSNDPGGTWVWKLDVIGTHSAQAGLSANSVGSAFAATNYLTASTFEADRVAWGINDLSRHLQVKIRCEDVTHPTVRVGRVIAHRSHGGVHADGR